MKRLTPPVSLGCLLACAAVAAACASSLPRPERVVQAAGASEVTGFHDFSSAAVRQAAMRHATMEVAAPRQPPIVLAGRRGELRLVSLRARAVAVGPLAFTELQLRFDNPRRLREGRFSITLPETAAVSRLSLRVGTRWQEAEVVERAAANRIYETFLRRKVDPALLEQTTDPTRFSVRVFPIAPRGVQIKISYSEQLCARGQPYRIPLAGLPTMEHVDVQLVAGTGQPVRLERRDYLPTEDFVAPLGSGPDTVAASDGGGRLMAARIGLDGAAAPAPARLRSLLVLFDTSAARARGYASHVSRLGELVRELRRRAGDRLPVRIVAHDQTVTPIFSGAASDFGRQHLDRLLARRALGASDLESTLRWAARQRGVDRILLMGGVRPTLGEARPTVLGRIARGVRASGARRIDVWHHDGDATRPLAELLASAGSDPGVAIHAEPPTSRMAAQLRIASTSATGPGPTCTWACWTRSGAPRLARRRP